MRLALTSMILVAPVAAAAGWRDLQRSEPPPPAVAPLPLVPAEPMPTESATEVATEVATRAETDGAGVAVAVAAVAGPPAETIQIAADAAGSASADPRDPCTEEAADCRDALSTLRSDSLADIDLDIRVGGQPGRDYPCECRLEGETFQPRRFATTTFTWKAAGYCHKPLYFEHWNLERYGHSHGFVADSFLSAAHFFARIPALPYQMGVELPWECVYPLGYYRPGSCAPWTVPAVPVSARGFAVGAAAATGIVFLLP